MRIERENILPILVTLALGLGLLMVILRPL
jgi:hypothetical protein